MENTSGALLQVFKGVKNTQRLLEVIPPQQHHPTVDRTEPIQKLHPSTAGSVQHR